MLWLALCHATFQVPAWGGGTRVDRGSMWKSLKNQGNPNVEANCAKTQPQDRLDGLVISGLLGRYQG
jgi:hypothetical protein